MIELTSWRGGLDATLDVPGDKSLTHRGILFSALAEGDMEIYDWLDADDTRSSLGLVQALGVEVVEESPRRLVLRKPPVLHEPHAVVDCGNSGTTMRLAAGLVTAIPGLTVLAGDASLMRRPMARVADPLRQLGVPILSRGGGYAPLAVQGGPHQGGRFSLPFASAQVKSALLLAGLSAEGPVEVEEPAPSRDHTERLIQAMGGRIQTTGRGVEVNPGPLRAISLNVPGDPSSAAFWCAMAALSSNRQVTIASMLFNPARTKFFSLLENMGASLKWVRAENLPEPWGSVTVAGRGRLAPVTIAAADVPAMIDEIPLLALLATQASGTSTIRGAAELRVKESDRIGVTAAILRAMGASIEEWEDGWVIEGPTLLHGAEVDAAGDHRMAMLGAVAATVAEGSTRIRGHESVAISYPEFFRQYEALRRIAG